MEKHKWEIDIKDGIDTDIFIDGKRIPYITKFNLNQDFVHAFGDVNLNLSIAIIDDIKISSEGRVIINDVEVEDDIGLQIYELLKQKYGTKEN
jgi:hypothetical protein